MLSISRLVIIVCRLLQNEIWIRGTRASLLHRLVPNAEMKRRFSLAKARFLTAVTYPLSNRGEKTGGNCNFQREIGKAQRATERPDPFGKTGPENGHK
jgi:hypothetical protein